ncbi:MAG: sugar ABC transporter permease [Anaerolineae bacterium]|nr:sugar ABC transporter permease [Anaerolineae bacterium]
MTPATTALPSAGSRGNAALTVLAAWHAILCPSLIVGALALLNGVPAPDLITIALAVGALLLGVGSAAAAYFIVRRNHLGRTLSLAINYLLFVACLSGLAHALGLFMGLDDLADYMARGFPFLMGLLFIVGYFIATAEVRERPVSLARRNLGRVLMAAGAVGFLLTAGVVPALASIPGKYAGGGLLPLALTLGALAVGYMLWRMSRRDCAQAMGAKNIHSERLNGWLFLSPNLLGFVLFFAGPLLFSLYVSFTNWDSFNKRDWVGLANYGRVFNLAVQPLATPDQPLNEVLDVRLYDELFRLNLFGQGYVVGAEDKRFWISLRNTLVFGLMAVPLSVIPALLLATLLNSRLPGMRFYRTLYFIPSVAAVVGVALIWQWMYNSQVGWINYFITSAVNFVNSVLGTNIKDPQIRWLADSDYALLSVVIMSAWQWLGFNTVLFLAGLQTIPRELYEAATVDGANPRQQFFNVTLPMLAPTTLYVLITTTIQALQVFDQVFIVSNGTGGPGTSTLTMTLNLYQNGFQSFRQGYASALAWVLFIVIFAFTLFQFRRQRRASGAYDM